MPSLAINTHSVTFAKLNLLGAEIFIKTATFRIKVHFPGDFKMYLGTLEASFSNIKRLAPGYMVIGRWISCGLNRRKKFNRVPRIIRFCKFFFDIYSELL